MDAIRSKMEQAGLSQAAVGAFLHQYQKLERNETGTVAEKAIAPIEDLPASDALPSRKLNAQLLGQTVLLKLNGGLGTSMGLEKAKSLLRVRGEFSFLDVIVRQYLKLRAEVSPDLRLLFMNSFSTSADTREALRKYPDLGDPAELELLQNRVPKIQTESLAPIEWPANAQLEWCPPGHGDIYPSLLGSGLLQRLLEQGKRYLFVSNADNLGATFDPALLMFFADSDAPFLMEVTRRTAADRKGGHLARRLADDRLLLRESAQCADEDMDSFQDVERHRYFNTNNLWVRLDRLQAALDEGGGLLPLPLIRNTKTVDPRDKKSPKVYQLETAMGAAIECFAGAAAIEVPRRRFAPVKTTGDLFAVRSDAYVLDEQFQLELDRSRRGLPPLVDLDDSYKLVDALEKLIPHGPPSLRECQSMLVQGPWRFADGVKLVGRVEFRNPAEEVRSIAPGRYEG